MKDISNIHHSLDSHVEQAVMTCKEMLCSRYSHLEPEIILYGSQVTGMADLESDIDLLILVNQPLTRDVKDSICDDIYEIDLELDVVISPLIKTRQQWNQPVVKILPLYQNIQKEGVRVA